MLKDVGKKPFLRDMREYAKLLSLGKVVMKLQVSSSGMSKFSLLSELKKRLTQYSVKNIWLNKINTI